MKSPQCVDPAQLCTFHEVARYAVLATLFLVTSRAAETCWSRLELSAGTQLLQPTLNYNSNRLSHSASLFPTGARAA